MRAKKVILVDDEEDIVLYFQTALEDAGYEALTAGNVREGLELIRREKPDLVCLDILMPEESGMSLYQSLRVDPELEKIPILIMSGLSLSKELKDINYRNLPDGTKLPAPDGVAEKPLTAEQFLAQVEKVLSGNHDNHN
jgi:DNA-binding response OmpR family regulator